MTVILDSFRTGLRGTPTWRPGRDRAAERHPGPQASPHAQDASTRHVIVVGGGIAGVTAAVALAERGVRVTLVEAEETLGGRVRSWPVSVPTPLADPEEAAMSRGFHAFFRQYYNLRALLRRVDPTLAGLRPVPDYPLRHSDGTEDSFTAIATKPPWNFLSFVQRSPSFTGRDLLRVDPDRALDLLDVDFPATYERHDGENAAECLDRLRFPHRMRSLALEVFARSFFADPEDFSAGELVAMFHMYFLGSGEGLLFDVARDDFDLTFWAPLRHHLEGLGADVATGHRVERLERQDDGFVVDLRASDEADSASATSRSADAVVLATDRRQLQQLVARTSTLGDDAWRDAVAAGRMAPRFIVQRLWFDRPVDAGRPEFLGTAAFGHLDNVSLVHELEDGARDWARRHHGSVVELHAYAVDDEVSDEAVLADLRHQLGVILPELADARPVHEEILVEDDCPLAGTDPWARRPGVVTPDPDLVIAGDGVRCELPVALMERAATTGFQAANTLLARWGLAGHDVWSVPTTARFPRALRVARAALRLRSVALAPRRGAR